MPLYETLIGSPLDVRKATLVSVLAKAGPDLRLNEHLERVRTARWCSAMPASWDSARATTLAECWNFAPTIIPPAFTIFAKPPVTGTMLECARRPFFIRWWTTPSAPTSRR
jgi:hypothetical protein